MLVTPTFVPLFRTLPDSAWDSADEELDEAPLAPPVTSAPPHFGDALPSTDDASATAFVIADAEFVAEEPEWLTVDPWTLEAVREYDARV